MSRHHNLSGLLLASGLALCLAAQDAPRGSAFRTDISMILVPVNVTDHDGKTRTGLRREDFTIFDEERPQPIVSFTSRDSPTSVGLVLDVSGSMRSTLNDFKQTIHGFLAAANPEDEFSLFTVSSAPAHLAGFTTNAASLESSVQWVRAGGGTALIDTIYLALTRMRAASRAGRALLVMSDGGDNHSRYSSNELMSIALEADTQIYTIIIDNTPLNMKPIELTEERQGWRFLDNLSERTGGINFRVRSADAARDAVRKVGEAIRNQYVIGYRAPNSPGPGKWHRIRVKADVPHVSVSARSGYYAR